MASTSNAPATGKIELIARGLLQLGSEILLCRNLKHGYYYLPGGKVEFGESSAQACEREFEEENGLIVSAKAPLLVAEATFEQRGRQRHEVSIVFHVEHTPAEPVSPEELREAGVRSREAKIGFEWADLAVVADLDLRPALIRAWLASGGESSPNSMVGWCASHEE